MKKHTKRIALVLSCVMIFALLAGCKKSESIIGKVNGSVIPDGLFINSFSTTVYEAQTAGDTDIDFELEGEALYEEIRGKEKDGTSYYDIFVEDALETAREFMIQYELYSQKEEWPSESEIEDLKTSADSYFSYMLSYLGTSLGVSTVEDLAEVAYGMTYDDLMEYYTMSGALENYKAALEESVNPTDDELAEFYADHEEDYRTVEVRHSLILTEDMDEEEKAEAYEAVQELVERYNAGEITFDDLLEESDDVNSSTGEPNNDGYYTVQKDSSFVQSFKDWALAQTAPSDTVEIVESEYGYHIMQCTAILDLTDETVKETVESAYKMQLVENQIEEETRPYLENKDYEIKDLNEEYIEKIVKRSFTGDFSDTDDSTASPSATAEPTPKPEYNDAAADETKVADYNGEAVLKAYYVQFFSQAMNEIFTGYDFSEAGDSEEKFYEILNEAVLEEYRDGKTYLEYAKEYGLELLLDFLALKDMATEAGEAVSEEERTAELEELDSQIDTMLEYYATAYNVSTRDELMQLLVGVNVNDYKPVYIDQLFVSEYANEVIEEMEPEDEALKAFYEKNPDDYRIVTIRHISKSLLDEEGNALSETEQAEVLRLMEALQSKLENGDSAEALVTGYSDASDASYSAGLLDLQKSSASIAQEVIDWAFAQNEIGAISLIKTDSSYELVIIEGLTNYSESSGTVASSTYTSTETVVASVTSAYKNEAFDESVQAYVAEHNLTLTDVQSEVVDQVAEEFLTYDGEAAEEE